MLVLEKIEGRAGSRRDLMNSTAMVALVIGVAGLFATPAAADTIFWDPGNPSTGDIDPADGDWNRDVTNEVWTENPTDGMMNPPPFITSYQTGDDVIFAPGTGPATVSVTLTENVRPGSITFAADPGNETEYTIVESATDGVNNYITSLVNGANGPAIEFIVEDDATLQARLQGDFIVSGNQTLTLDFATTQTDSMLVEAGATVELLSGGRMTGDTSVAGIFTNMGILEDVTVTNGGLFTLDNGIVDETVVVEAGGDFVTTGDSGIGRLTTNAGTLDNAGTTTVQSGTLTVSGAVTNTNGTMTVNAGATLFAESGVDVTGGELEVDGALTGNIDTTNGDLTLTSGTVTGQVDIGGGSTFLSNGLSTITQTLETAGTGTVASGTLTVTGGVTTTGGSLTVAETATLDANVAVQNGTLALEGGVTAAAVDGAVTVAANGAIVSDGLATISQTLNNAGATSSVDTGTLTVTGLVTNSGGTLTIENPATLEALADVLITDGTVRVLGELDAAQTTVQDGVLDLQGGDVTGSVDIRANGGFDSSSTSTIQGALDFAGSGGVSGGQLTVSGAVTTTAGTLTVAGATGNLVATSGVAVNGGTLDVQATVTGAVTAQTTGQVEINGGTVDGTVNILATGGMTTTGTAEITGNLASAGTVLVDSGTLTAAAEAQVTGGTLTVDTGATLEAQGLNGLDINGGTVLVRGTVTGDVTTETGGVLALNAGDVTGTVDVAATGTFTSTGAGASVSGVLTNDGSATVTGGNLTANAGVVNQGTGVLAVANGAVLNTTAGVDVNDGQFNASGTVNGNVALGADMTLANTGDINGTLTVEAAGEALANGGEITTVNNQGTFNLGSANTVTITNTFANAGTVAAVNNQSATLEVANTFSSTGLIDGGTAVLAIQAGLIDLNAGTTLAGTIQFLGDIDNAITLTFDGSYDLEGVLTNEATGVVTFSGVQSTGGFDVINEASGVMTVAGTLNTGSGALTNQGDLAVNAGATVTGATLVNSGGAAQLQIAGRVTNDVLNGASGVVTVTSTGSVGGTLDNAGTAQVAGRVTGIDNAATGTLTLTGSPTVTGDLQNEGTATVAAGAEATVEGVTRNQGAGVLAVAAGAELVSDVINTGTASLTVDGNLIGDVDNAASMAVFGAVTGAVSNTGSLDLNGAVNGAVTNAADLALSGEVNGVLTNQAAGTLTVDGPAEVTTLANAGQATVTTGQTLAVTDEATNQSGGTLTVDSTATLAGDVTNQSGATLALNGGTIDGTLTNDAGGTVTNAGDSTVTGELATRGTLAVNSGTLTVDGPMNSRGASDSTIAAGATLDARGGLTHSGTGTFDIDGTLLGDFAVAADAFADLDGTIGAAGNTSTVRNLGTFSMGGDVIGGFSNLESGVLTIDDTSSVSGAFVNEAEAMAMADLSYGSASNSGLFRIAPGVTLSGGMFTNSGTITPSGAVTFDGGLTSPGTINMRNGSLNDSVSVVGDANLNGSIIEIDADLEPGQANTDTISVTGGALTGTIDLRFTLVGVPTNELETPLEVLSYDAAEANDFSFSQGGLPLVGSILFVLDDDGAGSVNVDSIQNPALGGLASAVTLTQSLIGSVVNRPSSPFVTGLAVADSQPCGAGAWGRATGGPADATGSTRSQTTSGTEYSFGSELSADYAGVQFGGDFSCFDGYYNGWDLSFGGIGGINVGSTVQPVFLIDGTSGTVFDSAPISNNFTDFTQVYAGAYVSAFRNNLLLDLQYRFERTAFDLTNDGEGALRLGILDQTFNSRAQTLSGSAGYAVPLSEELGITFVPTLGFAITSTSTERIEFEDGAFLEIDDSTSQVGFVGASVSRSVFLPDNVSALTYFATGTVYNDFAEDVRSVYFDSPTASGEESFSSNLGTYGELSVGANYTRVLTPGGAISPRQFNASARVDARFGESLESWGVTGQVRYQF